MCEEYPYVAIGGIVTQEIKREHYKYFPWFINIARKNNAKIHALGFTSIEGLKKYHFDSVDSTAWLAGNRFGKVYYFNGKAITSINREKNKLVKSYKPICQHNFNEWVKYQKYAEYKL